MLGLEEVFVFDSKSENRDRAVEAVESVSEALGLRLGLGLGLGLEEVFVFDSESENRDRAVEAVESVSEARTV